MTLPPRPPCAEGGVKVAFIDIQPGYKHVSVWTAGVKVFNFLHNHNCVYHMVKHEVNPENGADHFPEPVSLGGKLH